MKKSRASATQAAQLLWVLLASGCGGGDTTSPPSANKYQLLCESDADVAGIEWTLSGLNDLQKESIQAEITAVLGSNSVVLNRPSILLPIQHATDWVTYSYNHTLKAYAGLAGKSIATFNSLDSIAPPEVSNTMCVDREGNPVSCTLSWKRL